MPGLFDRLKGELEGQEKAAGLKISDILSLPESLRKLCNWLLKQGDVSLGQVVEFTQQSEAETRSMLAELIEKGFVREIPVKPEPMYRIRLGRTAAQQIPINLWENLGEKTE